MLGHRQQGAVPNNDDLHDGLQKQGTITKGIRKTEGDAHG